MTQPTRGPWHADPVVPLVIDADGRGVADCGVDHTRIPFDQRFANARVIAASWDMWVELQRLHRLYGEQQTADVLAKVEGTQERV